MTTQTDDEAKRAAEQEARQDAEEGPVDDAIGELVMTALIVLAFFIALSRLPR